MMDFNKIRHYYIVCGYTDMRKQIDGLVSLIEGQYQQKVDEESIFLFCGRKTDRIKAIYWDGSGYILLYKRLAGESRFQWPRSKAEMEQLTRQQFQWLMEGLSIYQKKVIRRTDVPKLY